MAFSVAIRVDGELRDAPSELASDAFFPIYSVTKTLTAICALRLAESGDLQLGEPARRWLPEVDIPATITLTHLLHHTSGLHDYGPLPEYHDAVRTHPGHPWTRQQFLDAVIPQGLAFAPGQSWSYSNVGYMLVIDILERVTGHSFARIVDRFIAAPLELQKTSVLEDIDDLTACVPGFGSEITTDGTIVDVRGRYHPGWCAPRLIGSTAMEITHVFNSLLAGHLLAPDRLVQMLSGVPLPGSLDNGMVIASGMGVYTDQASKYGRNYHHGGGGPGYDLAVTVYPDTSLGRVAIAVFRDTSCGPRAETLKETLIAQLLDELLGGAK